MVEDEIEQSEGELRERVLRTLLAWFAIASPFQAGLLVWQASRHGAVPPSLWVGAAWLQLLAPLMWLHRRLGYRRTAALLVTHLLLACSYFQLFRGLTPGTVLGSMTFLLLAGLFFGARGVLWAFGASITALVAASGLVLGRFVAPWDAWFWDPNEPLVWVRYTVLLGCYGGGVAAALVITVSGLERVVMRLRDTLERERRERQQREIVQRELEKSKRLEALAQFAAGIAHDFNNNLSVIVSSAELIGMEPELSATTRELACEISKSAKSGASTVRQLLSLGRTGAGQPEEVQLDELLRSSLSTLRPAVGEGVRITLDVESEARVFVDAGRLCQALLNVAINARDAMRDDGHLRICLRERQVARVPSGWNAEPGAYVAIECRDDGVGIEPELIDKIFEPFFTTKGAQDGSGLGLAMVRKTIHDAGGFIEVESSVGAGTTFSLYLPIHAPASMKSAAR